MWQKPFDIQPGQLSLSGLGFDCPDPHAVFPTFPRQHLRLHYITGGYGCLKTCGAEYTLGAGLGFLIFPGTTPNYYPDKTHPWEYVWIGLRGELIDGLVEASGVTRDAPVFSVKSDPQHMQRLMTDICLAAIAPEKAPKPLRYYLYDLFLDLTPYEPPARNKSLYFDECLDFIHKHYGEDLTVQDISDHIAIDRTYLYRQFMQNLGISPQTYLIDYRITQACELLRTTALRVSEIAYAVGFRDFSDFSKQFKKRTHLSPSQYRSLGDRPG